MTVSSSEPGVVFVVDDDRDIQDGLTNLLHSIGLDVECFGSTDAFLSHRRADRESCILLDVRLPGKSGLDLQCDMKAKGIDIPIVFMTGHPDFTVGVQAMKDGAIEFLCKPFREQALLDAVRRGLERDRERRAEEVGVKAVMSKYETLTGREREVMGKVASGLMNKSIAAKLGISQVTVKVHRGSVMRKLGARSLADLVRMADAIAKVECSGAGSTQARSFGTYTRG